MGKMSILCAVMIVIFAAPLFGEDGGLSRLASGKQPIKVFIKDVSDESGDETIKEEEFRNVLEKSLLDRKSVDFDIVKNIEQCDVYICAILKKYQYLERGPLKITPSIQGMLLDAAASATENYAEMEAEFLVAEAKTNRQLWKDKISSYEKKVMTQAESVPIIYDKVARRFLWQSFGKPAK